MCMSGLGGLMILPVASVVVMAVGAGMGGGGGTSWLATGGVSGAMLSNSSLVITWTVLYCSNESWNTHDSAQSKT